MLKKTIAYKFNKKINFLKYLFTIFDIFTVYWYLKTKGNFGTISFHNQ